MIVAAAIAVAGLVLVAIGSRPGDGRAETAIALPLVATVALWNGYVAFAVLAGAALAYASLVVIERRTLLFGRRLRATATAAGAVVPLGILGAATLSGAGWPHPEVWLVGSVVPGVLAYDLRRQPPDRRVSLAVGGAMTVIALAFSGIVLRATMELAPIDRSLLPPEGAAPEPALAVLGPLVLATLAATVLVRWRYGLHVGLLSIPLVAVWTVRSPAALVAYLVAAGVAGLTLRAIQSRTLLYGRRLAATGATVGVVAGAAVAAAGAPALPAIVGGALAAEDLRLLRSHAGTDRLDALGLGVGLFAVAATLLAIASGAVAGPPLFVAATAAAVLGGVAIRTSLRRERSRPSTEQLRAADGRWVS